MAEAAEPAIRWYHSIDLPGIGATLGEYDLRGVVDRLPWPASLQGARCLDVGSRDGFLAFEMERRGAAEVVSLDVDDPADYDLPFGFPAERARPELDAGNRAFAVAHAALGSSVRRHYRSVYEVGPAELGTFDLAVVGTLLLHLRDPAGALRALRSVVTGRLILNEPVPASPALLLGRRPRGAVLMGDGPFWWAPNPAGLARLLEAAGFRVLARGRPYVVPWGERGPDRRDLPRLLARPWRDLPDRLVRRRGALHVHLLAEPA